MSDIWILLILVAGCGPRWRVEEMTLPSGDVLSNRYRYEPGFLDTAYYGNWTITWKATGEKEAIPGYGYRIPGKVGGQVYTNHDTFCFLLCNELFWRNTSEPSSSWQRMRVGTTPVIYAALKDYLDRIHPGAYSLQTNENMVQLIVTNKCWADSHINLSPQYGEPPYFIRGVDFDQRTITLEHDLRPSPLPKHMTLTNTTFTSDIRTWSIRSLEDNKTGSNTASHGTGYALP